MMSDGDPRGEVFALSESRRVLYVEDDDHNYLLVAKALSVFSNLEVERAASGEQALGLLRESSPDLLLLDLNLPGMSGYDILRAVRGMPRLAGVPAVALTANAMPEERERAEQSGFADFMAKPFSLAELRDMVQKHLGGLERP